jgi:hypothetical protein
MKKGDLRRKPTALRPLTTALCSGIGPRAIARLVCRLAGCCGTLLVLTERRCSRGGPTALTTAIEANLGGANFGGALVKDEQLADLLSLRGATMPDGQILKSDDNPDGPTLEEWRKRRGKETVALSLRGQAGREEPRPSPARRGPWWRRLFGGS